MNPTLENSSSTSTNQQLWTASLEKQLGVALGPLHRVGGGDFAQSYHTSIASVNDAGASGASTVPLQVGDQLFVKTHKSPPPLHFSTEALGLSYLAHTHTVNVPEVLASSDDPPFLALRWVDVDDYQNRNSKGEQRFGEQLARLHMTARDDSFGRVDKRSTGSLGLPNEPCSSWADFYRTQRLQPLMQIAAKRQSLPTRVLRKIEQVSFKLDELGNNENVRASLLHGDLWAGNRVIDKQGASWLIDPASHLGHREFDLAMMRLFGGFDAQCFSAYQATAPLADGWKERVALHQLAPLIVHAIKFGAAYRQATEDALNQYL